MEDERDVRGAPLVVRPHVSLTNAVILDRVMYNDTVSEEPSRIRREVVHMPGIRRHFDVDDLVRRYQTGERAHAIAVSIGCSYETVMRHLRSRDAVRTHKEAARLVQSDPVARAQLIAARVASNKVTRRDDIDVVALAADYQSDMSLRTLARAYGCSAPTVRRILREHGVAIRDQSEAGLIRASHESQETRQHRFDGTRRTATGRPLSTDTLTAIALTKQDRQSQRIGVGEVEMTEALRCADLQPSPQHAIKRYNVDILAGGNVVVEIHTSPHGPHLAARSGGRIHRRIDELTNLGFNVVYVWCTRGINADDTQEVVRLVEELRGHPPTPGQYRVLRCEGNTRPRRGGYRHHGTRVMTTSA